MPQQMDLEPKRIPLIIVPGNRGTATDKDSRIVNAYVEKDDYGTIWIYKRPGLGLSTSLSGAGRGIYNWKGDIYAIAGTTLYKNGVSIGTVDGTNGVYHFSSTLGTPPYLFLSNGVAGYAWDGTTLTTLVTSGTVIAAGSFITGQVYTILTIGSTDFTLVGAASNTIGIVFTATGPGAGTGTATISNYPATTVKGSGYLDGYTYVMNAGAAIFGSPINNPTGIWDPTNVILAQIEPDGGVFLAKQLVYIIALKQWTTEVFYDAGNPSGSPLEPVQGAKASYGCASGDSVQACDDILFWIATNRTSSTCVVQFDQLKMQLISTMPIERLLDDGDMSEGVLSWHHKDEGHTFYGVTVKSVNRTLVWDAKQTMWSQWTDVNGNYLPIVGSTFTSAQEHLVQLENGSIYELDSEFLTDDYPVANSVITVDIYTPNFDGGNNWNKYIHTLTPIGDQTPGSILQVRVSDDDYKTWSNFRLIDLDQKRPQSTNWGTFRSRAHHLRHACPTKFRIAALEYDMMQGTL